MVITTRSSRRPEDNSTQSGQPGPSGRPNSPRLENGDGPIATNPAPNAHAPSPYQMMETMQQLLTQNQQILQLMIANQGGAQFGVLPQEIHCPEHHGAPHLGANPQGVQGRGARQGGGVTLGTRGGNPLGA